MPPNQRRSGDLETGSWRPTDAELGSIIENRVDEAYILSWPGPLEIWVPVHDTGGYDRVRAPVGSYDFRLDQIKGTTSLHAGNQIQIGFYPRALHLAKNLDFTFVYFSLELRNQVDPVFKVPSVHLPDIVKKVQKGDEEFWIFTANRSGLARDGAAKYQIGLAELAGSNGWSVLPSKASQIPSPSGAGSGWGVSTEPIETSTFFKRHFDAAFLEVATGDEMLLAARPDVFGRHRLIFSKSTGKWISLSIHGGTLTGPTNLIQANIHRASFVPHPRHYILIEHYEHPSSRWYPWSWLICSLDFARLARGQGAYLLFTTTLNEKHVNRWTPLRIPSASSGAAVLGLLRGNPARKVA